MTRSAVDFSLIGPGRVGSSVALALSESGYSCRSIVYKPLSRRERRLLTDKFPRANLVTSPAKLLPDFKVLFIAVKDDQICDIAAELSRVSDIDWKCKTVLHFSGIVGLEALSNLQELGASTGALHPISPFAAKYSPEFARSIYYDFLGTATALRYAREIVKRLQSKLIVLHSEEERALLHIASVIASNSVVIAVKSAEEMISSFIKRRDSKSILNNLLSSTTENISSKDGIDALTGPLVRGDINVIESHIKALRGKVRVLQFYKSSSLLGIEAMLKQEHNGRRRTTLIKIKKLLEAE
ncbi:MAG: DUF2520 domain-containing protein [Bacteroidetes bacterium]|nr:DUF2520 domain-containing protein [Bacteroidota bacterium]